METFDHVVVGGGIVGASIAYHLTKKSAETVLLLERNELASAASSRAAGLILQASTKASKTPLAILRYPISPRLTSVLFAPIVFALLTPLATILEHDVPQHGRLNHARSRHEFIRQP